MKCKKCSKIFTLPAKKNAQICSQCNEEIPHNNLEGDRNSFRKIIRSESKKFYNKEMEYLVRQIKNAEEQPKYSTEPINYEIQKGKPTTIERLKKYAEKITVQKISKTFQLKKLKEKYPHPSGIWEYNDRNERQYGKLVSTKELNIAEFVLKWKYEHQHRIHKYMPWELLTERLENIKTSNEFLSKVEIKFE